MRVTRHAAAPGYQAAAHHGVATLRLQGHEAGPTDRFWVGLSYYLPGGGADETPAGEETVYVVLDGSLVVQADGKEDDRRQRRPEPANKDGGNGKPVRRR